LEPSSYREVSLHNMSRDNAEASQWIFISRNQHGEYCSENMDVVRCSTQDRFAGSLVRRGIMHFELVRYYGKPWGSTAANDR
jgi:hypothetical protein